MGVLLISYDLNAETTRPKIVEAVRGLGEGWARLSESSYAVSTYKSPETAYGELKKHTDQNDQIYIVTLKRPYTGFGPKAINDWLEENLTY